MKAPPDPAALATRIRALAWATLEDALATEGHATTGALLTPAECRSLAAGYAHRAQFRSRVVMARHGFGSGEYQYYAYPLPADVAAMRAAFYPPLAVIANRWAAALGATMRYPDAHAEFLARCHAAGQQRPTALLLEYGPGDYNCLHQDVYGETLFPLQVAILLSRPGEDFTGGEFVLTEQRPRKQSRVAVVPLVQGEAVIFPVRLRPAQGVTRLQRFNMRHGVSRVRDGRRHVLGLIFHDAT
ncbi:MAG: 2OG-Fe(II) oxygenase [Gammaproteobacteria bacterium]|nr:2OG-Fe(II) oxygenase [Gammaproteobacteria bacterium]